AWPPVWEFMYMNALFYAYNVYIQLDIDHDLVPSNDLPLVSTNALQFAENGWALLTEALD
ncbi:hypothetical protein GGF43_000392, partial [Coemansia sp. RSA 2618]